jgi:hypothetical protein
MLSDNSCLIESLALPPLMPAHGSSCRLSGVWPAKPQNRKPSKFSFPHARHVATGRVYGGSQQSEGRVPPHASSRSCGIRDRFVPRRIDASKARLVAGNRTDYHRTTHAPQQPRLRLAQPSLVAPERCDHDHVGAERDALDATDPRTRCHSRLTVACARLGQRSTVPLNGAMANSACVGQTKEPSYALAARLALSFATAVAFWLPGA